MIGRRWRVGLIATMLIVGPLVAWGGGPPGPPGALAANAAAFTTPTPGPDGKIIYIVQEGDDLWTIAALIGKSVEELMALNGIQPGDYITPGMELVLGSAGPVLPTAAPEARPTITLFPVTPTPVFGTGEINPLLGPGYPHIAEPPFLLHLQGIIKSAGVGKQAFLHSGNEDNGKFQAFGRMKSHQRNGILRPFPVVDVGDK